YCSLLSFPTRRSSDLILFTWPLAANFTNFANGSVQDVYHELWYLNLDYHLPYGPFFALHTNSILYPYGVPLYFQVFSPLHAIIGDRKSTRLNSSHEWI